MVDAMLMEIITGRPTRVDHWIRQLEMPKIPDLGRRSARHVSSKHEDVRGSQAMAGGGGSGGRSSKRHSTKYEDQILKVCRAVLFIE